MKRNGLLFVEDILSAINPIKNFFSGLNKKEFINDELRQSAIIRKIEIIGEAVKNISEETKDKYSNIEWKKIAGTRDIFSHAYFEILLYRVWDIVKKDIPILKQEIQKIKTDIIEYF